MSLIYRAIWQDARDDLCDAASTQFQDWTFKVSRGEIESIDLSGSTLTRDIHIHGLPATIDMSFERAMRHEHGVDAVRASLKLAKSDGERWNTTLRAWVDPETGSSWTWVDNSVVGEQVDFNRLTLAAPHLAVSLVDSAVRPISGGVEIDTVGSEYEGATAGEELSYLISDQDRSLPITVFCRSDPRFSQFGGQSFNFESIISATARRLAGQARVVQVDANAAKMLTECLGSDHGLWDGAYRVYLQGVDPAAPRDSWRHRYVTADRYMRYKMTAGINIARALAPVCATRRPPACFDEAKAALARAREDRDGYTALFESQANDLARVQQEVIDLRRNIKELEERDVGRVLEIEELSLDLEKSIEATERTQRHLDFAVSSLVRSGVGDAFIEDEYGRLAPRRVTSAAEAVQLANKHLSGHLTIHPKALRDGRDMDRDNAGPTWAQTAWRAFRSLHAYAESLKTTGERQGFDTWCHASDHPLIWHLDRLAMTETSELMKNKTLAAHRDLPVSVDFDPTGTYRMQKHLKVSKAQSPLVPRIYFEVDFAACRVHVGFYGPHKHMPTKRRF